MKPIFVLLVFTLPLFAQPCLLNNSFDYTFLEYDCASFQALLRQLDLNENTRDGFSLTEFEYEQLRFAWLGLNDSNKTSLLSGPHSLYWKGSLIPCLLLDLDNGTRWETFREKLVSWQTLGLSLTLTRHHVRMTLDEARSNLVDLLLCGNNVSQAHVFSISPALKKQASLRAGRDASNRLEKWECLINKYRHSPNSKKAKAVNTFFNRNIRQKNDSGANRGCDYWQSPVETIVRGFGDCDDFAVAKYISLRLMNVPADQLRIAVVEYAHSSLTNTCTRFIGAQAGMRHAVLFFYHKDRINPLVLDNLQFHYRVSVGHFMLPLSERKELHDMTAILLINELNSVNPFVAIKNKMSPRQIQRIQTKFNTAMIHSQQFMENS